MKNRNGSSSILQGKESLCCRKLACRPAAGSAGFGMRKAEVVIEKRAKNLLFASPAFQCSLLRKENFCSASL
jgi:hypothetical protein